MVPCDPVSIIALASPQAGSAVSALPAVARRVPPVPAAAAARPDSDARPHTPKYRAWPRPSLPLGVDAAYSGSPAGPDSRPGALQGGGDRILPIQRGPDLGPAPALLAEPSRELPATCLTEEPVPTSSQPQDGGVQ